MNELMNAYYSSLYCESTDWNTIVSEAQITFGGKAYPKFGQVVIVSGGSGSGKGFVIDNLFGIEGKRFDVDYLKTQVAKNQQLRQKLSEEFNVPETIFDLKNSNDVSKVHEIMKKSGLKQKYENNIFMMAKNAAEDKKPNLIFDKTCKTFDDIYYIIKTVKEHGYKAENIHFVWVVSDYLTAVEQNNKRERKVDEYLLKSIHMSVANTMNYFFKMTDAIINYLNGDMWIVFNKKGVDSKVKKLKSGKYSNKENFYIEDANYFKVKSAGNKTINMTSELEHKIKSYVPAGTW
jgi:dephospho-CoA kinase